MTTSTNLVDYIGQGTLASRPAAPSLNPSTFGLYWSTDVSQLSLWDGAWNENVLTGSGSSASTLTGLVTGGVAVWESALTFRVSAATYYINGVLYSSLEQTITLSAAHATLDRIDVIALDTSGNVVKVTGTAAATPSEPDIDQATQLKLTFVLVNATVTSPTGVTTENVYLENTEWTSSTVGSGFTLASTNNPYAGTKDIEGTAVATGAYVQLQRASPETLDSVSSLNLFIRSKASWTSGRVLRLQFYSAGVAKGQAVTLATGFWGFDSSITSGYQFVAIPISQFVLPAGTSINQLRITDSGGSIGFYIDNITLTTNGTGVGAPASGITQAQADARYQPLDTQLTSLAALAYTGNTLKVVRVNAGETGFELATVTSGSGNAWNLQWGPLVNEAPSSNFATLDSRNGHPCLDFDTTTQETAIFSGVLPADYSGAGIAVHLYCSLTSATTGTVGWDVSIERMDASTLDIDADSFATAQTVTAVTVPGTSGQLLKMSVNISNGANMDSLAAGEMFRLRVRRDVANDTATGDAELLRVMMVSQ